MSTWHSNLPPEKAARQMAQAEQIRDHFHICRTCGQKFDGQITWECPPGSPTLLAMCAPCAAKGRPVLITEGAPVA